MFLLTSFKAEAEDLSLEMVVSREALEKMP